ncbi:MAG: hypothetical protein K2J06_02535, partial [Muribaculaceae bacterium]|nr:hypothetical protein [Muribaculaceae bacterium]
MKLNKKVLALALAAFVATGTATISAANDGDNNKPCTEQTTCKKGDKKECKKGKKDKNGEGRHEGKGRKGHANLFNGVELTADQQTAIKNLREKRQSAEKKARENNREAFMTELKGILTP